MIAAGAIGWKMYAWMEIKRVSGDLEQLKSRIQVVQAMAVNMQADWEGTLKRDGSHWIFEVICLDPPGAKFSPIRLRVPEIVFNEKSQNDYPFLFSSSGEIRPSGSLVFHINSKNKKSEKWELSGIFGKSEGSGGLGPAHPDE